MKELLEYNPIIGAIKDEDGLKKVIESDCNIVFLLNGDILTLKERIDILKKNEKEVFIHLDMVSGISSNPVIIEYLKNEFNIDGIITTKTNLIKKAIELNLKTVQRFFFVDSLSIHTAHESLKKVRPDAIEIMPGIMPKVIKQIHKEFPNVPIICGGLISTKEEIIECLSCGAMAISTTLSELW